MEPTSCAILQAIAEFRLAVAAILSQMAYDYEAS